MGRLHVGVFVAALGVGCSSDQAVDSTGVADGGKHPTAGNDARVGPVNPGDAGPRGMGPFAAPCDRTTGLWKIRADSVSSLAKSATTYLIDFDTRRIVARFPLVYDATNREWTSLVDPTKLPGQVSCGDLERYGVVMLAVDGAGRYMAPTTSYTIDNSGSWSQGGCSATAGIYAPAESQAELFAWDPTGDILSAPSPMTAADGGADRRFTVHLDPLPLCGSALDVIYISVARVQGKVVVIFLQGDFAVR